VEETALHFCGRAGDVRLVKHLLSCGADGHVEDVVWGAKYAYAVPILSLACCSGRFDHDHFSDNPWYLPWGDLSMVETLIKYADVYKESLGAIRFSMGMEEYDIFGGAVTGLADQYAHDEELLHHKKIVQLLVENGAAPGWTLGRLEMPQILKEVLQGKHSLLAAAALGNVQAVSEHIAKGADLGARNLRGRTALMLARKNGLDDIVKMLLKAGADINTSIHSAAYNGHTESITALLQGGAAVDAKLEVRGALLSFMSRALALLLSLSSVALFLGFISSIHAYVGSRL
jgi:hypothetical protein